MQTSHPALVEDYRRGIKKYGFPVHQEAAYVYKNLKEKYGEYTLKILGNALFNPIVNLDSPISFYDTVCDCYERIY